MIRKVPFRLRMNHYTKNIGAILKIPKKPSRKELSLGYLIVSFYDENGSLQNYIISAENNPDGIK